MLMLFWHITTISVTDHLLRYKILIMMKVKKKKCNMFIIEL